MRKLIESLSKNMCCENCIQRIEQPDKNVCGLHRWIIEENNVCGDWKKNNELENSK